MLADRNELNSGVTEKWVTPCDVSELLSRICVISVSIFKIQSNFKNVEHLWH